MVLISGRLQVIADMVAYDTLVDVGSDHALLPISLLIDGRIKQAISADIASSPLERGRANAIKHGVAEKLNFMLSNGLEKVAPGFETCVIAGMGGESIMHILRNYLSFALTFKQLILSPQRDVADVRRFLHTHGFKIANEVMLAENGKFYNILDCSPGVQSAYTEHSYIFGHHLISRKCPVLKQYIENEIEKFTRFGVDRHIDYLTLCKEVLACIK